MLNIKTFKGGFDDNLSYIIWDDQTKQAAVVETSLKPDLFFTFAAQKNLKIEYAIIMHSHFDHMIGLDEYRKQQIPLYGHPSLPVKLEKRLQNGQLLQLGTQKLQILFAPGHAPDCLCIIAKPYLFTTDVLFINGCGRCDLQGSAVKAMFSTLQKIKSLPDHLVILPGHDYGTVQQDTLANQKKTNPYLLFNKESDFIEKRLG